MPTTYRIPLDSTGKPTAYAWPGGYRVWYLTHDNATLCAPCVADNLDACQDADDPNSGWLVIGHYLDNETDETGRCDHCYQTADDLDRASARKLHADNLDALRDATRSTPTADGRAMLDALDAYSGGCVESLDALQSLESTGAVLLWDARRLDLAARASHTANGIERAALATLADLDAVRAAVILDADDLDNLDARQRQAESELSAVAELRALASAVEPLAETVSHACDESIYSYGANDQTLLDAGQVAAARWLSYRGIRATVHTGNRAIWCQVER